MDCVSESDVEEILISVLERRVQETSLTEQQKKALHAVINRQGRVRHIANRQWNTWNAWKINYFSVAPRCLQICVSTEVSVDSHIRELRNRAISAASLSSEDVDENNLLKGAYSFVFGSPKSFLQNEKWRTMLRSDVYQDRTFAIVAREVHVVPKW